MNVVTSTTRTQGFTIVELLIVIVVIAILAAITIVSYNGIQARAYDAAVTSDLNNFAKKLEIVKLDNGDVYPTTFTSAMGFSFSRDAYEPKAQNDTLRYCVNTTTNEYVIHAASKSDNFFIYTSEGGLESSTDLSGWGICSEVGLVQTNPSQDGIEDGVWAAWVN